LQGVEQKTLLPFIRSTTELTKGTGASKLMFLQVPDNVTIKLQSYIQRHRLTANTIMQGVWSLLLHRYTGSNEIVFGVIVSGRPDDLARVEQRVGMYINTLPLHSSIKEEEGIVEWLQNLQQDQISSRQFQHTPLFDIQEWTGIQGDFFDSLLVFQNYPLSKLISSGEWALQVGNVEVYEQNNFPLTVTIRGTEQISVEFRYNSELLKESYVEEIRGHFHNVLQQIVEDNKDVKPGDIKLLTSTEEHQLLSEYNTSKVLYPKGKSVTDLFELQVEKTPSANALRFEKTSLSYQELNERSNQLAHFLRSRGVKEETLVPLCMERGLDMVVAMLAILKAGAAYVAIDTDFPADRISYMVEDSGASIAVSSSNSRSKLEDAGIDIIAIDEDWIEINQHKKDNLKLSQPNDLAYVIYTSGSTGNPKGVMIEHRSLVDYVYGLQQRVPVVSECQSFALVSTIATDLGNTVIYSSLLLGGCLHVFSKEAVSDAELLQRYFKLNQIDCLKIVPSHWKALSADEQLLLPNKLLVFGGEALQAGVIESIRLSGSSCQVVNHYGPTETTIGKLLHVVEKDRQYKGTVPIGKPFSNTRIYVLSKEGQPCPVGIPGQLFIAGDGIARGYVNNTSLTAEKFIQDPFSKDGSLMYSTGDLVKWLPDGNIEFIGRVDNQVKIRGYRVEPGDIESVLQQSDLVSQAVVLAREDKEGI
jgi:amino acid adenylation domain-containing protein